MLNIEELYETHKRDLYCYLLSLTHDHMLTEDLLSETFVCAIKSLSTFRGDSTIKTWLFGIARNLWLQSLRISKREEPLLGEEITTCYFSNPLEDNMVKKEAVVRIHELLMEKDDQTRQIISMRIHGYSYREIATKLHISENSARVIEFRTKRHIKTVLEKENLYL